MIVTRSSVANYCPIKMVEKGRRERWLGLVHPCLSAEYMHGSRWREAGPWGKLPNTTCNSCGTLPQNITHPSLPPQKWLCFLRKIRQANGAKKGQGESVSKS